MADYANEAALRGRVYGRKREEGRADGWREGRLTAITDFERPLESH